jgi:hypothetical protein
MPRRGAPAGNLNAAKHGRRSRARSGFVVGKGAKRDRYIIDRLRGLTNRLEILVDAAKGEISIMDAALINSAVRWEKVAALGDRWHREEGEKLNVSDRLNLVKSIAQASDNRDKCIKALGIDVFRNGNPLAAFHAATNGPITAMPHTAADAATGDSASTGENGGQG